MRSTGCRRLRDEDLVFPSLAGTHLQYSNLMRRVLKPAADEAGVPWAGSHTFRHTFASRHIERGTNVLQLSRLLGHNSPSFTLDRYGHLMDAGMGEPLDLDAEIVALPGAPEDLAREDLARI